MYKILVFSDTHKNTDTAIRIIGENPDTNLVLHAGDHAEDAEDLSYIFPEITFSYVKGNCDLFSFEKEERFFEASGKKIFLTHGHLYKVKMTLSLLRKKAKELGADIVVFGHTHQRLTEEDGGILYLNPGARGSYGVILIGNGKVSVDIFDA